MNILWSQALLWARTLVAEQVTLLGGGRALNGDIAAGRVDCKQLEHNRAALPCRSIRGQTGGVVQIRVHGHVHSLCYSLLLIA